jgi:hypothetical protein
VWWNSGGTGPVNEIKAVITSNQPHYKVTGLMTGQNYGFAVKTINAIGMSDLTDQI